MYKICFVVMYEVWIYSFLPDAYKNGIYIYMKILSIDLLKIYTNKLTKYIKLQRMTLLFTRTLQSQSFNYVNVSRWYNHIEVVLWIFGAPAEGCCVTVEGSAVLILLLLTPRLLLQRMMMMLICFTRRLKRKSRLRAAAVEESAGKSSFCFAGCETM